VPGLVAATLLPTDANGAEVAAATAEMLSSMASVGMGSTRVRLRPSQAMDGWVGSPWAADLGVQLPGSVGLRAPAKSPVPSPVRGRPLPEHKLSVVPVLLPHTALCSCSICPTVWRANVFVRHLCCRRSEHIVEL
jgi:hypothetical protein